MPNVAEELLERAKKASQHIPHVTWAAFDDGERFVLNAIVVDRETNMAGQIHSSGTLTASVRADPLALSREIASIVTNMLLEIEAGPNGQPPDARH